MFDYSLVQIARSETTTAVVVVPPWEVAVLAAVHGGDITSVVGVTPVRRELPEAAAEYERLANKYGKDEENGQEYVAMVYGVGARGVTALQAEIAKTTRSSVPAAAKPASAAPSEDADPLAGLDLDPDDGDGVSSIDE